MIKKIWESSFVVGCILAVGSFVMPLNSQASPTSEVCAVVNSDNSSVGAANTTQEQPANTTPNKTSESNCTSMKMPTPSQSNIPPSPSLVKMPRLPGQAIPKS